MSRFLCYVGHCACATRSFRKSNDPPGWTVIALFCNNSFILSADRVTGTEGAEFVGRSNKLENIVEPGGAG